MGGACSAGGDLTTPLSVEGCPICDNTLTEQATWAGNFHLTQERLHDLATWNEQAPFFSTFDGLVDYLTGPTKSDVEGFWVLFYWIQFECRRQQTHKLGQDDSPWGYLRAVQNGTRSHAELYKKLCRTAGLKCKTVTGLCKVTGNLLDKSSADQGTSKSSWNEVTVDGKRALVDCSLELDFQATLYPPFYFLTHPSRFATAHFPDNKSFQLLKFNISQEQFLRHATCFSAFFDLEFLEPHTGVIRTEEGIATLKLGTTKSVNFSLQSLNGTVIQSDADLSKHVKEIRGSHNSHVTVVVRPPFTGRFRLQISIPEDDSETLVPVCLYTIVCEKTAADCSPFEGDAAPHQKMHKRKKKSRTSESSRDPRDELTNGNRHSSVTWSDEPMKVPHKTRSVRKRSQIEKHSEQIVGAARSENAPSVHSNVDHPKTYEAWTRDCVVHRPKARTLAKGALVRFKLTVPHADSLAVLLPRAEGDDRKITLKSRDGDGTWKGKARVPDWSGVERRRVLVAGTANGTTREQRLLEYDIGDRNPPEGESAEDHGSDLKLQDLKGSRLKPLPEGFNYHVMISYSWAQKSTILKIKEHLNKVGYKVWLDEDEMGGTLLESMARGVRSSAIIIIAFSEHYAKSPNCKQEANFARDQKRELVPLKMTSFIPDNWLGILIAGKYFVDFSSPGLLIDKLKDVEFQIEDRLKKLSN